MIQIQRRRARRICGWLVLAIAPVCAQAPAQFSGVLLEYDPAVEAGEFCVRGPDSEVIRFRFDVHTRVDRAGVNSSFALLRTGEPVEVKSDSIPDSPLRYAVLVTAVEPVAPPRIVRPARIPTLTRFSAPADPLFPRGTLTFSGVVSFLGDGRLILRTRSGSDETILLRRDTRYLAGGGIAASSDVKANMRVFVRAGKDLFGHTEAYQVMWGDFLEPRQP